MHKILIICGPTATGKTAFGMEIAKKFNGEMISADSRQVYTGMDIVTGKDLPPDSKPLNSNIKWRDRKLKYYIINGVKIWLYDVVSPLELFNVAFWHETATIVIRDITGRGRLPVVVGGTGLFLKSIYQSLPQISVPSNPALRQKLEGKTAKSLFNYLNRLDSIKAASLNTSDKQNPRRLIRAIEIYLFSKNPIQNPKPSRYNLLAVGLTAPLAFLKNLVDKGISDRMKHGAMAEVKTLVNQYGWDLPSMTACGYRAFKSDDFLEKWKILEHQYIRRQLTWFKKQPYIHWFDISSPNWQTTALNLVTTWYNKNSRI